MDPVLFLQFIKCYGLGTEVFWQKNAKNVTKNHIWKPPTFTLIILLSIQPVKIPEKITVFFNNSCRKFNFFPLDGQKCQKMNGVLIQ